MRCVARSRDSLSHLPIPTPAVPRRRCSDHWRTGSRSSRSGLWRLSHRRERRSRRSRLDLRRKCGVDRICSHHQCAGTACWSCSDHPVATAGASSSGGASPRFPSRRCPRLRPARQRPVRAGPNDAIRQYSKCGRRCQKSCYPWSLPLPGQRSATFSLIRVCDPNCSDQHRYCQRKKRCGQSTRQRITCQLDDLLSNWVAAAYGSGVANDDPGKGDARVTCHSGNSEPPTFQISERIAS